MNLKELVKENEKKSDLTSWCPCDGCNKSQGCLIECSHFRRYVNTGNIFIRKIIFEDLIKQQEKEKQSENPIKKNNVQTT